MQARRGNGHAEEPEQAEKNRLHGSGTPNRVPVVRPQQERRLVKREGMTLAYRSAFAPPNTKQTYGASWCLWSISISIHEAGSQDASV